MSISPPQLESHYDPQLRSTIARQGNGILRQLADLRPFIIAACIAVCVASTTITVGGIYALYHVERARQRTTEALDDLKQKMREAERRRRN